MAIKLTARQEQVLELIRSEITRSGFPPTRAEIAKSLGFKSANAAEDHLRALAKKGAIVLTPGASRGIRLVGVTPGTASRATNQASQTNQFLSNINQLLIPLIGRVAAGTPILATEHIEREIGIEPSLFLQTPDYLLRVQGLSMRDAGILDGDLLAVQKTPEARHGQIIVARLGEEVTVKRLFRSGRRIELLPENPDYQPIIVGPHDDFNIEGIAVGLIRNSALN